MCLCGLEVCGELKCSFENIREYCCDLQFKINGNGCLCITFMQHDLEIDLALVKHTKIKLSAGVYVVTHSSALANAIVIDYQ